VTVNLSGKVALVTGATGSIGAAAALGLARLGMTVVIVARDQAKGESAVAALRNDSRSHTVELLLGDLSSLSSVRELAESFCARHLRLHFLLNNAAVFKSTRTVSADGFEMMFATNHLGPFLLTNLLLDVLQAGAPSMVLNVTAPSTVVLNFDDLQGERRFNALNAFGATKMANLLSTFALAQRLSGTNVVVNAYHPGIVRSNLMREAAFPMNIMIGLLNRLTAAPPERAAEGIAQLAVNVAGGATGQFFRGAQPLAPPAYALRQDAQERLWEISAGLTGLA
jgi:NAD(P)-dependent dehydrogenase (short-subunit alcohol dehydrogenase family)